MLLHFPHFDLYRKQAGKQADLVLALQWFGDAFSDEEKDRDFAYYEALTWTLSFAPRLPPRLERLAFRLVFRGRRLKVDVTKSEVTYSLLRRRAA